MKARREREVEAVERAAVVVEVRYSDLFKNEHVRPWLAARATRAPASAVPGRADRTETRKLGEEWTYRFLAAAARELQAAEGGGQPERGRRAPE